MPTFEELGIAACLAARLAEKNITVPAPVQTEVIPAILKGESVAFQSETGTGKTFAYLLPLLTSLYGETAETKAPRVIIIAPTHELASQIRVQTDYLCRPAEEGKQPLPDTERDPVNPAAKAQTKIIKSALFIGGAPLKRQIEKLKEKPLVVIGGPARLLELIQLKKLKTDAVGALVLDEADRLYSPELRDLTAALAALCGEKTQIIACSATVKEKLLQLLPSGCRYIKLPTENILTRKMEHWALHAEKRDKIDCLRSLLLALKPPKALIFCGETGQIANMAERLRYKKVECLSLHAKTDKFERKKAIDDFRNGKCRVLITSDLASRGLDIDGVTHVIQTDLSENEDFFIHRAGRTARAGQSGVNIIIGDEWELRRLAKLEKKLGIIVRPKVLYGGKVQEAGMGNGENKN